MNIFINITSKYLQSIAYIKFSKCLYLNIKMRHYLIKTLSLSSKIKHFVHFLSVKMKKDIMKTHKNSKLLTSRKKKTNKQLLEPYLLNGLKWSSQFISIQEKNQNCTVKY